MLDVGCGDGVILEGLQAEDRYLVGVDFSTVAAVESHKRGIEVVICDIRKGLPFKDKVFDLVLCFDILEHLFNPEEVLNESKRICSKNILINIPNVQFWVYRVQYFLGRIPYPMRSGHIQWWILDDFESLLKNLGLEVLLVKNTSGHLPFEKALSKIVDQKVLEKIIDALPQILAENFFVATRVL